MHAKMSSSYNTLAIGLVTLALMWCGVQAYMPSARTYTSLAIQSDVRRQNSQVTRYSKMPKFDPAEEEELKNILDSWDASWSNPPPKKARQAQSEASAENSQSSSSSAQTQATDEPADPFKPLSLKKPKVAPKLQEPNMNWRQSVGKPIKKKKKIPTSGGTKPASNENVLSSDFGYDEFELAMFEEESSIDGFSVRGSKMSAAPTEHDGLYSGDAISEYSWDTLLNHQGMPMNFEKVHQFKHDILVLYVDPRRMTEDFKIMLQQLGQVPGNSLQAGLVAVNCDDWNDHRKFAKKGNGLPQSVSLLNDPKRILVDEVRCKTDMGMQSALILMDVESCQVLKVWYQNDWDVFTTRDLITDEIKMYRQDPREYMEAQIGLR